MGSGQAVANDDNTEIYSFISHPTSNPVLMKLNATDGDLKHRQVINIFHL